MGAIALKTAANNPFNPFVTNVYTPYIETVARFVKIVKIVISVLLWINAAQFIAKPFHLSFKRLSSGSVPQLIL